ncbi:unnamed protein product [Protopolystoma xenopodis]|uniref:Uncharacterized protein n=1 Tax=Protopolystoma xenopodis TaxID=117903 RepID=A0A448WTS2_9PLAT|nr:unnamed protein product [Protopolystoma xenopodis]
MIAYRSSHTAGQTSAGRCVRLGGANAMLLLSGATLVNAVANLLCPTVWSGSYARMLVFALIFGGLMSPVYTLNPHCLLELLPRNRLADGLGFFLFFTSASYFLATPISS